MATVLTLAGVLAGCGGDEAVGDPTGAVALVAGARSNMPPPQLDGPAAAVFDQALQDQSLVTMVVADGEPAVQFSGQMLITGNNGPAREESRERNRETLAAEIEALRAEDEEADLLTALEEAARSISAVETPPRTIVVVDSGLSTVAPLDFTQPGLLEADPEEVVDNLVALDALPDLGGVRVILQGIGDTAEPQQRLSIAQRNNLIAIWKAIIAAANGGVEPEVEDTQLSRELLDEELPRVTLVPVPEGPVCVKGTIVLTGADVAFRPDSAEFVDEAEARTVLAPIAGQLVGNGVTATLTGTTADVGDITGQKDLSRLRAEAVRDLLVDLDVPAGNLTPDGVGSEFPGYVQDHDAEGNLLPGPAAQNRKVIITPSIGTAGLACD
ncbi:OmpA family protein [Geodermatophilus sp. SYSU D00697]